MSAQDYSWSDEPFAEDFAVDVLHIAPLVASPHGPEQEDLQLRGKMYYNPVSGIWWKFQGTRWVQASQED